MSDRSFLEEDRAELEYLRVRVEYAEAMARHLHRQVDEIISSRTWRLLTGAGALWRKAVLKINPPQACATIEKQRYHRWIASCERREIAVWEDGPRFAVATSDERTLRSLRAQTYRNWEVGTQGDYLITPAPGDELSPDALYLFAQAARNGADLVYCDEDALDAAGLRVEPWFKPDWSPDLMTAKDYIGRAYAVRRKLAGRPPEGCIMHLPRVLYHRRGPVAVPRARVRYPVQAGSHVEIVVTSCKPKLLECCLRSLRSHTSYPHYTITVIDNSCGEDIQALAARFGASHRDWRWRPFSYSAMNNAAATQSAAPLLLFLHDDTTMADPEWLQAMVEHGCRPEVGAVGARLLHPDRSIQHSGVTIGIFGVCGHVFRGWPSQAASYGELAETTRNVSAVTGACLLMRAEVFRCAGGFDEHTFPVKYSDIDLCLRVLQKGKRIVYTPHATLFHQEAYPKSWPQPNRGAPETLVFQSRWLAYIRHDPFYNPNLTRADETCGLRSPEECT